MSKALISSVAGPGELGAGSPGMSADAEASGEELISIGAGSDDGNVIGFCLLPASSRRLTPLLRFVQAVLPAWYAPHLFLKSWKKG